MAVQPKGLSSREHLVPLVLYQMTPRMNCGDCGFASCLAFSTQAVKGEVSLDRCPHLDEHGRNEVGKRLAIQLEEGIGVKRENFQIALDHLFEELARVGLEHCAERHGLTIEERAGRRGVVIPYLHTQVWITARDIEPLSEGESLDPWEKIFLLNYLLRRKGTPSGRWVGFESIPGSISKRKNVERYCEKPLGERAAGNMRAVAESASRLGGRVIHGESADLCLHFDVFPALAIRILFWDADQEEGFEPRVKFLFDQEVMSVIDLERLWFACEKLTGRLLTTMSKREPRCDGRE